MQRQQFLQNSSNSSNLYFCNNTVHPNGHKAVTTSKNKITLLLLRFLCEGIAVCNKVPNVERLTLVMFWNIVLPAAMWSCSSLSVIQVFAMTIYNVDLRLWCC